MRCLHFCQSVNSPLRASPLCRTLLFLCAYTERVGKRESSEPALKLCFSALSALDALAKCALGCARQTPKSHKNQLLEGRRVLKEQIGRTGKINFRGNMRILQGNLPKHVRRFALQNRVWMTPSCLAMTALSQNEGIDFLCRRMYNIADNEKRSRIWSRQGISLAILRSWKAC